LDNSSVLTLEEAKTCFDQINFGKQKHDPEFSSLYQEFLESAIQYSLIRANWSIMTQEERRDQDATRTIFHNNFIAQCQIIERYMESMGLETTWTDVLGKDRKRIGDFVCHIFALIGISQR